MQKMMKMFICTVLMFCMLFPVSVTKLNAETACEEQCEEVLSTTQTVDRSVLLSVADYDAQACPVQYLRISGYLYLSNNGSITSYSLSVTPPSLYTLTSKSFTNYGNRVVVSYQLSAKRSSLSPQTISGSVTIYSNFLSPDSNEVTE